MLLDFNPESGAEAEVLGLLNARDMVRWSLRPLQETRRPAGAATETVLAFRP